MIQEKKNLNLTSMATILRQRLNSESDSGNAILPAIYGDIVFD